MLPTNSNFDDEEDDDASQGPNLLEHIEQVREIFKQIDPSGTRGLNYDEFKTVLTDILNIEFDDDDPD